MYRQPAELYDEINFTVKNYKQDAKQIEIWIQKHLPHCKNILDVACGTGEHALHLKKRYHIDGIDLNEEFLKSARKKNPKGHYRPCDMTRFDLGKKYDLILCLFSSIGYARTLSVLRRTLKNFARHLSSGGMVFLEPWVTPQQARGGQIHLVGVENERFKACRMAMPNIRGRVSTILFHYLLGKNNRIQHFTETHKLGLFTEKEMRDAFDRAGFDVRYEKTGLLNRGIYLARLR